MFTFYNPPYDSPIEDAFARQYTKHAPSSITFAPQVRVNTICGLFILDFLITTDTGFRIAVECDGKEFHNESRDEWRDAMILGGNHVDAIYRLRGSDIHYRLDEVMCLLCRLEPNIFCDRAFGRLRSLASEETLAAPIDNDRDIYTVRYSPQSGFDQIKVEVRRKKTPKGRKVFWESAYAYANSLGNSGLSLDHIIDRYRIENPI